MGAFVLRVVIPVTAVAAVLAGLRALNNKGSGRVRPTQSTPVSLSSSWSPMPLTDL